MSSDEEGHQGSPSEEQKEETTYTTPSGGVGQAAFESAETLYSRGVRAGPNQEDTDVNRTLFPDQEEEGQQEAEDSQSAQEEEEEDPTTELDTSPNMSGAANTTTTSTPMNLPTVFGKSEDMFVSTGPLDETRLAGGACQHPRSERVRLKAANDLKSLDKIKRGAVAALPLKFTLPNFLITQQYEEEDETGMNAPTKDATEAIIGVAFRCKAAKIRAKQYDLLNALNVPTLKDINGLTPLERWDFTLRRNLFDLFGTITKEEILMWSSDSLLWCKTESDREDQEWLLELARNSCTLELQVNVDRAFDKLPPKHQGGVVYWWLVFQAVVQINDDIVTGLKNKIKQFALKGMLGYTGENVESARTEIIAICTRLFERNALPDDAVNDIIQGLGKASHKGFAKIFEDFLTAKKNTLLVTNTILIGTSLEQIDLLFEEAGSHYATFVLNNEWVNVPSVHFAGDGGKGIECDNCKGPHTVPNCDKPRDEARIVRNRQARLGNRGGGRGGGGRGGGGRGGAHSSGRGGGANTNRNGYGRGKWSPPKDSSQLVKKIDKKVYCACKICGWNNENGGHTTGSHDKYVDAPTAYMMSSNLKIAIAKCKGDWVSTSKRGGTGGDNNNNNNNGGSNDDSPAAGFNAMLSKLELYEKEAENPDDSAAAGAFGKILRAMLKD